jgi:hypothetical protein
VASIPGPRLADGSAEGTVRCRSARLVGTGMPRERADMANSNARLALLIVTLMFGTNLAPKGRPQRGDRGVDGGSAYFVGALVRGSHLGWPSPTTASACAALIAGHRSVRPLSAEQEAAVATSSRCGTCSSRSGGLDTGNSPCSRTAGRRTSSTPLIG